MKTTSPKPKVVRASDDEENKEDRKKFMEAFGETQHESVQRINALEAQLKELRAKSKKEED